MSTCNCNFTACVHFLYLLASPSKKAYFVRYSILLNGLNDACMIFVLLMQSKLQNHIGKLGTLMVGVVMADEIPAYPYVPYSSPYLLLPLPLPIPTTTPTPTPPLTYYHGRPQHFCKGGARGCHLQILLWGCCPLSADSARCGGEGGGGGCACSK